MLNIGERSTPPQVSQPNTRKDYLISAAVLVTFTGIAIQLRHRLEPSTFAMLFLLGVVGGAMRLQRVAAILNALLSFTAFYYFCVPVHDSFVLEDPNYIVFLVAMLAVALAISTLTFKVRSQAAAVLKAQIEIESERTRNSFLNAVSHDIKTPLSSIYGAATALLEEEDRIDTAGRHELVQSIANEAERLNQVVVNLLEMTRLDAGMDINRDWYPLEEIVGTALTSSEKVLRGRSVSVSIPSDLPLVYVDDVLLEQLFINLLENFSKYTPVGSRAGISAAQRDQQIIILVCDNGPGFPAGQEQRVFDKFFRGKTEGTRGVGLGLAICRAIVDRHQGVISAANLGTGGAVITIELPFSGRPPTSGALPENTRR